MNQTKLNKMFDLHEKWLNNEKYGSKLDLYGLDCSGLDFSGRDLSRASFYYASFQSADFHDANLSGADLRGANLCGANLRDAILSDANLRGASLRNALLSGADLSGADLRDVGLYGAKLQRANLDFSCFPLWCGSFDIKVSEDFQKQIAYHLLRMVGPNKETNEYLRAVLKDFANEAKILNKHDLPEIE